MASSMRWRSTSSILARWAPRRRASCGRQKLLSRSTRGLNRNSCSSQALKPAASNNAFKAPSLPRRVGVKAPSWGSMLVTSSNTLSTMPNWLLSAFGPQTRKAARPPGRSTRRAWARARSGDGVYIRPRRQVTTSNLSSSKGSSSMGVTRKAMLATPCSFARRSVPASISATRSEAVTLPSGPTRAAMEIAGSPTPEARSRT